MQMINKSLDEWLTYIQGIHVSAIDMGLSRVEPVAQNLGVIGSAKKAKVFTVAGTNGKGSTTAAIAEICQQAGYKTALYQSPELIDFNERIKINGRPIQNDVLIDAFEKVEQARKECNLSLSFFEMTSLAAFLIFAQNNCDVWVLEVGLGGRLDVVNIIDPNVALITNIGIDHVDWLGDDKEKIGYEKAGILRQGIPLIFGDIQMPASVQQKVDELDALCYQAGKHFAYRDEASNQQYWQYSNAAITMQLTKPSLALVNVANAISAVLASGLDIQQSHIEKAMQTVKLAGRFDYQEIKQRRWLFDVAHNEDGVDFLINQLTLNLSKYLPNNVSHPGRIVVVFSMLADKEIAKVVERLKQSSLLIEAWYVAPIQHSRAANLAQLKTILMDKGINQVETADNLEEATKLAIQNTTKEDLILVCGSFHTIGESLRYLLQS